MSWAIARILVRESDFIELQTGFPRNVETLVLLCVNFQENSSTALGEQVQAYDIAPGVPFTLCWSTSLQTTLKHHFKIKV